MWSPGCVMLTLSGGKLYPRKLITPFNTKNRNILTKFIICIENRTKNALKIVLSWEILFKIIKNLKFMRDILSWFEKSSLEKKLTPFV